MPARTPAAAPSQAGPRTISLVEGRGELLPFQHDILRVVISEPRIADAVVVSPREVMVNAKAPGSATVLVWETGSGTPSGVPSGPARFDISVTRDNSEFDAFCRKIQDSSGGSPVLVTGSGETIVLTGAVKTAEDSKRLASMAQTRAKNVINLLKWPPPPSRARSCSRSRSPT